jgi:polyhydroxyalkanoate synthesis regulator phasin
LGAGAFRVMALSDLVQKAFYLGIGLASYAGEKAGGTLGELRVQAQKLVDELVARGEMTTEEAKRMVDELVNQAQQPTSPAADPSEHQPRRIEILTDSEPKSDQNNSDSTMDTLRQQVQALQDELKRLRRE